eukprot:TRINITY_DN63439_c0_g1_i1.p1 TRINITY_DN63439_c0_g1~~TRINITY_DN63439_c0_g1_i1.p1  ORF type:complete len:424 (-),score=78.84 TRINITY_DN63439_c0_g1_i1:211-1482(-)
MVPSRRLCLSLLVVRALSTEITKASFTEEKLVVTGPLLDSGDYLSDKLWQILDAVDSRSTADAALDETHGRVHTGRLLHDMGMLLLGFVACKLSLTLGRTALTSPKADKKIIAPTSQDDGSDVWGCTALHKAAWDKSSLEVGRLLKQGSDPDARDAWDETPLHMAARSGDIEAARVLLLFGANVDAVNFDEKTPLLVAADAGHEAVCELLLDRGATARSLQDEKVPCLSLLLQRMPGGQANDSQLSLNEASLAEKRQYLTQQKQRVFEGQASDLCEDRDILDSGHRDLNLSTAEADDTLGIVENWQHLSERMHGVFRDLALQLGDEDNNLDAVEAENLLGKAENWQHPNEVMQRAFEGPTENSEEDNHLDVLPEGLNLSKGEAKSWQHKGRASKDVPSEGSIELPSLLCSQGQFQSKAQPLCY